MGAAHYNGAPSVVAPVGHAEPPLSLARVASLPVCLPTMNITVLEELRAYIAEKQMNPQRVRVPEDGESYMF